MKNTKNTSRSLLLYNGISFIIVIIFQLCAPLLGKALLETKVEFIDEGPSYWIAQLIETTSINNIFLLIGILNVILIGVAVNTLLNHNK